MPAILNLVTGELEKHLYDFRPCSGERGMIPLSEGYMPQLCGDIICGKEGKFWEVKVQDKLSQTDKATADTAART